MSISNEAVEAAARTHQALLGRGGYFPWDALRPEGRELRMKNMRAALEAAMPLILDMGDAK